MGEIVGKIALRFDKYKNRLASVYWSERVVGGRTRQNSVYWGVLPTKKVEALLPLFANPERNERRCICRMLGMKMSELPKENFRNPDFLKQILARVKDQERPQKPSPAQIEALEKIRPMWTEFKASVAVMRAGVINGANYVRTFGIHLEGITGHKRLLLRDHQKILSMAPTGATIEFCRFALSTAQHYPDTIDDLRAAYAVWARAKELLPASDPIGTISGS